MQVRPFDVFECMFGVLHGESIRADIHIQRTIETITQIKATRFEDRSLAFKRAVGIICGGTGGNMIALYQNAVDGDPLRHGWNFTLYNAHGRKLCFYA